MSVRVYTLRVNPSIPFFQGDGSLDRATTLLIHPVVDLISRQSLTLSAFLNRRPVFLAASTLQQCLVPLGDLGQLRFVEAFAG